MRKSSYNYFLAALLIVAVCGLLTVDRAYAAENKAVRFFKNLIKWPFGITKKSAETVGRTTKRATTMVTKTGTSSVEMVTGKPEKIKDVVVEPVKGSAETTYTAVEGTIKAPIEGTEEAFKSEEEAE